MSLIIVYVLFALLLSASTRMYTRCSRPRPTGSACSCPRTRSPASGYGEHLVKLQLLAAGDSHRVLVQVVTAHSFLFAFSVFLSGLTCSRLLFSLRVFQHVVVLIPQQYLAVIVVGSLYCLPTSRTFTLTSVSLLEARSSLYLLTF